jgi:hypothetical protein
MSSVQILGMMALAGLTALSMGGCSSTSIQLPSKRMCEAAGGAYVGTTCNPGGTNPRTAKQMCDTHGGTYRADLDACQMGSPK